MGNPLFNALGGMASGMMGGGSNPMQMLSQLKSNPLAFLKQKGFNVPGNMNNPNEIVQYLMNSGQINQAQYEQARQMAQGWGFK